MKPRMKYFILFILLVFIEVMIALFIHDQFIRSYIGDVLVVIVLYYFARIFIPEKFTFLPAIIFVFAAGVEVLQYFHIVQLLGLENNRFMSILLGSVFDLKDILCYGVGCLLLQSYEFFHLQARKSA